MSTIEEITQLVLNSANDFNGELEYKIAIEEGGEAALYGEHGVLDSINLVTFIIAVEQEIATRFGREIILADEKAMSQRASPFRTVASLAEHIEVRMRESLP